jgi:exodeoxyribonuclease VII small subunit
MPPTTDDQPTFETALSELERILRSLEEGTTTLEASLEQYERGVGLLKLCFEQLRTAEQRILLLSNPEGGGKPSLIPFDHAPTVESAKNEEKKRTSRTKLKET